MLRPCHLQPHIPLFTANIQHKSPVNVHFLVLVILEFKSVHVPFDARDFGTIEGSCFRVACQNMFADRIFRKNGIGRGDSDQSSSSRLVDLTWCSTFRIWLGVLNFVSMCA